MLSANDSPPQPTAHPTLTPTWQRRPTPVAKAVPLPSSSTAPKTSAQPPTTVSPLPDVNRFQGWAHLAAQCVYLKCSIDPGAERCNFSACPLGVEIISVAVTFTVGTLGPAAQGLEMGTVARAMSAAAGPRVWSTASMSLHCNFNSVRAFGALPQWIAAAGLYSDTWISLILECVAIFKAFFELKRALALPQLLACFRLVALLEVVCRLAETGDRTLMKRKPMLKLLKALRHHSFFGPDCELRICSKCALSRNRAFYSTAQWDAAVPGAERLCHDCAPLKWAPYESPLPSVAQQSVSPVKCCGSCGATGPCTLFSTKQWKTTDKSARCCKTCQAGLSTHATDTPQLTCFSLKEVRQLLQRPDEKVLFSQAMARVYETLS